MHVIQGRGIKPVLAALLIALVTTVCLPAARTQAAGGSPSATSPGATTSAAATVLNYAAVGTAGPNAYGNLTAYGVWQNWVTAPAETDAGLARTVWCPTDALGWPGGINTEIVQAAQNDVQHNLRGRVWLVFNEPDEPATQCGALTFAAGRPPVASDPTEAARRFTTIRRWIKVRDPYARVFAGGLLYLNSPQTRNWWRTFLNTLDGLAGPAAGAALDGVHVHAYGRLGVSPTNSPVGLCPHDNCLPELTDVLNDWYVNVHQADPRTRDLPIWITEAGWLDCVARWDGNTPAQRTAGWNWVRDNAMAPLYAWFTGASAWDARYPGHASNVAGGQSRYRALLWFVSTDPSQFSQTYFWCSYLADPTPGAANALTPLGIYWNRPGPASAAVPAATYRSYMPVLP